MNDGKWVFNRLKCMNIQEILWRFAQKILQREEYKSQYQSDLPVTEIPLSSYCAGLNIDISKLAVNWNNKSYALFKNLYLPGGYNYEHYKNKWSAGFQTEKTWDEEEFSYSIKISQREDIGDIRTNWELNRHYQFACLAKNYYLTGDRSYKDEIENLFINWNEHNLFLHGVEWTSTMEIAIRVNSWVYTCAFLKMANEKYGVKNHDLERKIEHGIFAMTDYIVKHRARYSSANNHLIMEMYAVALVGIVSDFQPWSETAIKILTDELPRQNYSDGVNKEMSLHYQTFVMEAYGLLMLNMQKNEIEIPDKWVEYLNRMSKFVFDSCGKYGEVVVFGDNDEGKLLDLKGDIDDHYRYILDLMSCVLDTRYGSMDKIHENICWDVPSDTIKYVKKKKCYGAQSASHYEEGGYTFLRSKNANMLIGIDHAELGFGSIAAHGHADALSFQMFVKGVPVFLDPGTFNYHVTAKDRNEFRSTANHNTVLVNCKDQSEMLGPFLWGNKASARIVSRTVEEDKIIINTEAKYGNVVHNRCFTFDLNNNLMIKDCVQVADESFSIEQVLLVAPEFQIIKVNKNKYKLKSDSIGVLVEFDASDEISIRTAYYSKMYGSKDICQSLRRRACAESKIGRTITINVEW